MAARLVVLGTCGAWPQAGRACSGLLVQDGGFRMVIDLGYGTLPRLMREVGSDTADGVDAVVITHGHADHAADLHGLCRARALGRPGAAPLPLYAPDGVVDLLVALDGGTDVHVRAVFDVHPLPAPTYQVGPFRMDSVALPHGVPTAGIRLATPRYTIAYTGDTGPDPAVADLGRDADLFVMEATDVGQQAPPPAPHLPAHLTAREAGALAARAGAKRVLLTHFWPGNDRSRSQTEAAAAFGGPVSAAYEGLELPLG